MNPSEMTNDQLAESTRAHVLEIEARAADHPAVLKWVEAGHACFDRAAERAVGAGEIQPMSVGGDKD